MERKLHFHKATETEFFDYVSIGHTESTAARLRRSITIPKFQAILGTFISIEHFRRIKRYLRTVEVEIIQRGMRVREEAI